VKITILYPFYKLLVTMNTFMIAKQVAIQF